MAFDEDSVEGITLPIASCLPLLWRLDKARSWQTHKSGKEGTKEEDPRGTKRFKGLLHIPGDLECNPMCIPRDRHTLRKDPVRSQTSTLGWSLGSAQGGRESQGKCVWAWLSIRGVPQLRTNLQRVGEYFSSFWFQALKKISQVTDKPMR